MSDFAPPTCSQCHTSVSTLWEKLKDGEIQCINCYRLTSRRTLSVDLSRANISFSPDSNLINQFMVSLIRNRNDDDVPVVQTRMKTIDDETPCAGETIISDFKIVEGSDKCSIRAESLSKENVLKESVPLAIDEKDVLTEQKSSRIIPQSTTRKSNRIKPSKSKAQNSAKALATKGRGRRIIFKRNPIKSSPSVTSVVTRDHIFYNGSYWQVGDIVSVLDLDDDIYYAQLRGFLQDQYLEKSAVITWLIPTVPSDPQRFVSNNYVLGPDEEVPRKMECFEFVCHAPSDYYRCLNAPYPTLSNQPELGFIWTHLGPKIEPITSIPSILLEEENPTQFRAAVDDLKTIVIDKKEGGKKMKEPGVKKQTTVKEKTKKLQGGNSSK